MLKGKENKLFNEREGMRKVNVVFRNEAFEERDSKRDRNRSKKGNNIKTKKAVGISVNVSGLGNEIFSVGNVRRRDVSYEGF